MALLRNVLGAALLFGSTSPAIAGDDIEFARALARDGQVGLAEEWCERLAKDARCSPEDRAAIPLVRADIAVQRAQAAASLAEVRDLLGRAAAILETFASENAGHPKAAGAKLQAATMRRQQGETIVQELKDTGGVKTGRLASEGRTLFQGAAKAFEEIAAGAAARRRAWSERTAGRAPTERERAEEQELIETCVEATFQGARALYGETQLVADGRERDGLLTRTHEAFMSFELDWGDSPVIFEASLTWALVYHDRGDLPATLARFDHAMSVVQARGGVAPLPGWEREVVLRGFGGKAQMLNEAGRPAEAIATVDEMLRRVPGAAGDRPGAIALLEKAEALRSTGRAAQGVQIAKDLAKSAVESIAALAKRRLAAWGGGGLEGLVIRADGLMQARKWEEALKVLEKAVAAAEGDPQQPELLWKMATVFDQGLDRLWEAATVYEAVAMDFPKSVRAPQAAFQAARAWNRIAAQAGPNKGWERDQVDRLLKLLVRGWPDDPNARNAVYVIAEASWDRGDFAAAAADYLRVPPGSPVFDQARVMAGRAVLKHANSLWDSGDRTGLARGAFALAECLLRSSLGIAQPAQLPLACRQALVSLLQHPYNPRPAEALALLEDIERAAREDDLIRRTALQIVRSRISLADATGAAVKAEELLKRFPASKEAAQACRAAAAACDAAAERVAGTKESVDLWLAAGRLYAGGVRAGIESGDRPRPGEATDTGNRVVLLAFLVNQVDEQASFATADLASLPHPELFREGAEILQALTEERFGRVEGVGKLLARLGLCHAFAQEWEKSRDAYERMMQAERLRGPDGRSLNVAVVADKLWAFAAYEELGHVYVRLGLAGSRREGSWDPAYDIFANVLPNCAKDTAAWWRSKYGVLRVLLERGSAGDFELARAGLENLRSNNPDLDGGKFGMEPRIEELERRVREKAPR